LAKEALREMYAVRPRRRRQAFVGADQQGQAARIGDATKRPCDRRRVGRSERAIDKSRADRQLRRDRGRIGGSGRIGDEE
jgi:hypothetical protein